MHHTPCRLLILQQIQVRLHHILWLAQAPSRHLLHKSLDERLSLLLRHTRPQLRLHRPCCYTVDSNARKIEGQLAGEAGGFCTEERNDGPATWHGPRSNRASSKGNGGSIGFAQVF
jgi:hypothetical protein